MKPKILFVTEKWRDAQPNSPLTNSEHNLFGSLEASDLAVQSRLHFDEYFAHFHQPCDAFLIRSVIENTPDLIVFSFIPWYKYIPSLSTIATLSTFTKLVFVWPDAVHAHHVDMANKFEPYSSLSILWDVDLPWRSGSKYVHLWTPQDPRIYNNPRVERDLDVTFVGSQGYLERHSAITYLKNNGVEVTTAGGQKSMLDVNQYANLLQRSKISLNFCQNNEGFSQLKGRIFESTSCGAMLMESQHDVNWIERWFLPMVHYVPFTNHEDLKNKINYYLSNDEERNRIAENGWRKTMESYSNVAWWSYVLKECGIEYE